MIYHVRLLKGLRQPYLNSQVLVKAEKITGFWWKIILLALLTIIFSAASAYFGLGNEVLSSHIDKLTSTEFEAAKLMFALGQILWSLFAALIVIIIPSLFFWTLSDREWRKFIVVQLYVLSIFLLEKFITAIFTITMGLAEISNPFSLGIIGQMFTEHHVVLHLLAQITLFKIWAVFLQYRYVKTLAEKSTGITLLIVLGLNLVLLLAAGILNSMQLEKLL